MYLTLAGLRRPLTVERPAATSDARGGTMVTWSAVASTEGIIADSRGRREIQLRQEEHPITHEVIFEGTIDVRPGDRLRWGAKRLYVHAVVDPAALGLYTVARCEERQDGD